MRSVKALLLFAIAGLSLAAPASAPAPAQNQSLEARNDRDGLFTVNIMRGENYCWDVTREIIAVHGYGVKKGECNHIGGKAISTEVRTWVTTWSGDDCRGSSHHFELNEIVDMYEQDSRSHVYLYDEDYGEIYQDCEPVLFGSFML